MNLIQAGAVLLVVFVVGCDSSVAGPKSNVGQTVEHSDKKFVFDQPAGWSALPSSVLDEHTVDQIELQSKNAQSSILIRVLSRDGIDPNEHDLALIQAMGYTVVKKTVHDDARVSTLYGYGEEYELKKDGKRFHMFQLVRGFDEDYGILMRILSNDRSESAARAAAQTVADSLVIQSVDSVAAVIENPKEVGQDWFTHQSPDNWVEEVETHKQYSYVEQRAFGESYIRFTIYDRTGGNGGKDDPQKELSAVLENGMHTKYDSFHTPMNSWLGYDGVGAEGTIWQPLWGMHDFKLLFVPLKDGRTLGIKKYQAQSSADLTDPGFELIESTFKLLVEPASADSAIDP
ncbi:MAG: hypothetical protein JKX70_11830 [Phycisphaerales bacterium]|nr:hypothetical protein [Phycisphaerales bacterium]